MKKWYCFSFVAMIATFVLEILPYGAILNFGKPDGSFIRMTYSYFSMTPFGYADFGPFPTALFSVVILIGVAVLFAVKSPQPQLNSIIIVCSIIAFLFSILPVIQDKSLVSDIGIIISGLLLATISFLIFARIRIRGNK